MATFKCKMCGGALDVHNETVVDCEYCGTRQTLPKLDDDRKANLYDRANHFRRNNEFDKAMSIYEQLLNEDGTDAEAYWSLVLCRYGIEYVEDPKTGKRTPTVNRVQFTAVFDDDNYKSALQYADPLQRQLYEAEAKTINEIQKEILAISQKEEPFDVFICYKETDQNGRRTPDSVLATELYHQLVREGFKVFFSRITLEDKLGTAYEPYIFAALNSAKVMVVMGTRPEYFQAVWVKNEWSRYLSLIRQGQQKILIPAYRDMDPYDLPEEFSHLQAQDMSKLGFMQDLLYGIKKLVKAAAPQSTVVKETVVAASGVNTEALLKRAFMFLEDGNWADADAYCEKVLDTDPECAKAYLGKLMAQQQVKKPDYLESVPAALEGNSLYQKAVRFADESLRQTLTVIGKKNAEHAEEVRKDKILAAAKAQADKGYAGAFREAIALLETVPGWKDADALLDSCRRSLDQLVEKEQDNAKRTKKTMLIILPAVAAVAVVLCLILFLRPVIRYNKAVSLMESGSYPEAIAAFEAMDGYKDSAERITECQYQNALGLLEAGEYAQAQEIFYAIDGYKDTAAQIQQCQYRYAVSLLDAGDYQTALAAFQALGDYEDSADQIKECQYRNAVALMEAEEYSQALDILTPIKNYKDSASLIAACQYPVAVALMEKGRYTDAQKMFRSLGDYEDSQELVTECAYQIALKLLRDGKYYDAQAAFEELGDYQDSAEQIKECTYQIALSEIADGYVIMGYEMLVALGDYKDSAEQAQKFSEVYERCQGKSELFTEGQWWDDVSQRCNLYMDVIDEETIEITVEWTYDAWTIAYWEMIGKWDPTTGLLNYSNCEHYLVGGSGEKDYNYYRGSGCFYFADGWLYWEDHEYNAGENCRFYSWAGI